MLPRAVLIIIYLSASKRARGENPTAGKGMEEERGEGEGGGQRGRRKNLEGKRDGMKEKRLRRNLIEITEKWNDKERNKGEGWERRKRGEGEGGGGEGLGERIENKRGGGGIQPTAEHAKSIYRIGTLLFFT